MIRPWIAATAAAASPLLLGLALATGDRDRLLERSGRPAPVDRRRGRRSPPADARWLPPVCAVTASLAGVALGGPVPALLLGVGGAALPIALRRRRHARRVRAVQEQLIDAVAALASGLRAGRSLPQSLRLAGSEVGPPLGPTLRDVADRVHLGELLDAALGDWEERVGGADARLVAGVLRLHRRTGGALGPALDDLGRTLRARLGGERELRALTSQARLSAAILGLLPIGFFLFLSVVSRGDVEGALRTQVGASAIVAGVVLQGLAFLWIRRLMRVEPS